VARFVGEPFAIVVAETPHLAEEAAARGQARGGWETLTDGRRSMVGWFEALDDWGENVALTRSRRLIGGSLSLDGFRSGWMAAMAALRARS